MKDDKELILDLEERIKTLERALQFYGNPKHYERGEYWTVVIDGGRTARKAIKEAAAYVQEEKETQQEPSSIKEMG